MGSRSDDEYWNQKYDREPDWSDWCDGCDECDERYGNEESENE